MSRPTPELEEPFLSWLARGTANVRVAGKHDLWVYGTEYSDPADEAVFGRLLAKQRIGGEPWLIRGVLRAVSGRQPVLSRVTIEHFKDPSREVTGTVVR